MVAATTSKVIEGDFEQKEISAEMEIVFDERRNAFWLQNQRDEWISLSERSLRRHLKGLGRRIKTEEGETLSQIDQMVEHAEMLRRVEYAGPLAGWWSGFHDMFGKNILVTSDPLLIAPEAASADAPALPHDTICDCRGWPVVGQLIRNLLSSDDYPTVQLERFFGYVRHTLDALYDRRWSKSIALGVAGEADCGKTLLFVELLSRLFGRRFASPYKYMIGRENFNRELVESVLLPMDDEINDTRFDARNLLAEGIKGMVTNVGQRLRGIQKDATILQPLWRPVILVNLEPSNLMVLPPIEEDNYDKFLLLKAWRCDMPMPADTPAEQALFMATMESELPRFIHWIRHEWEIPKKIRGRFGVKWWHHPEIVQALNELSNEWEIWAHIQHVLFQDASLHYHPEHLEDPHYSLESHQWMGTADDLRNYLREPDPSNRPKLNPEDARKLPKAVWLGRRLTKLKKIFPKNFRYVPTKKAKYWLISEQEIAKPKWAK